MLLFRSTLARAFALCLVFCSFLATAQAGYIYVSTDSVNGNSIYGFSVDETTGELTPLAGFPVTTGFTGGGVTNLELATVDVANKRLYVGNRGSSNISVYSIDQETGAITPLPFSPITGVANERTLKVHPSGSPLIVGADSFASYVITDSSATHAPGSPYALPTAVNPAASALSPDGSYYYAGGNSGASFAGYEVNASTGELTPIAGSPFESGSTTSPVPLAIDASGRLFLTNPRNGLLRVFTLSAGVPTPVAGSPFALPSTSFASLGKIHPNGQFLAIANRTNNNVNSFAIGGSGAGTTMSLVTGSPFPTGGTTSIGGVFNSAGDFFFIANGGTRNITRFSFDETTGAFSNQFVLPANTIGAEGSISGIVYFPGAPAVSHATVGGRVTDANGRPLKGAMVTLSTKGLPDRIASTGTFGNFRFYNVATGLTYNVSVKERRNNFLMQSFELLEDRLDIDFSPVVNTIGGLKN